RRADRDAGNVHRHPRGPLQERRAVLVLGDAADRLSGKFHVPEFHVPSWNLVALSSTWNLLELGTVMSDANHGKGPENLADILGRLFTSRGWGRKNDRLRLESAWATVAGEELLKDTQVLGMKRGVLEIAVRNAVLMSELTQFHKRGLLTK